jgi:hypothetical protein
LIETMIILLITKVLLTIIFSAFCWQMTGWALTNSIIWPEIMSVLTRTISASLFRNQRIEGRHFWMRFMIKISNSKCFRHCVTGVDGPAVA